MAAPGRQRSARYALAQPLLGLPGQQPLFWTDEAGRREAWGQLTHLGGERLHLQADHMNHHRTATGRCRPRTGWTRPVDRQLHPRPEAHPQLSGPLCGGGIAGHAVMVSQGQQGHACGVGSFHQRLWRQAAVRTVAVGVQINPVHRLYWGLCGWDAIP